MAFIPIPFTAKVEFIATIAGQLIVTRLYFERVTEWDIGNLPDLAVDMQAWWELNAQPLLSNNYILNRLICTAQYSASGEQVIVEFDPALTGDLAVASSPPSTALVITQRTAQRGRSFRGRTYVAGIPLQNIDVTIYGAGVADDWVTAFDTLIETPPTDTTWVVVSLVSAGVPRVTGVTTPITSVTSDGIVRSQRRREQAVGA